MIRTIIEGVNWGLNRTAEGAQLDLVDQGSNQVFHIPFNGDSLMALVQKGIDLLTDEQKKQLSGLHGGIILPGNGDVPENLRGPQG